MSLISKPIIPIQQTFYDTESNKILPWKNVPKNYLDFRAISCFCSLGFMLDDDTFSNKIKVLKPATDFQLNEDKEIIQEKKNWNWHHNPVDKSFVDFLDEFSGIFEKIINDGTNNKRILLPISGGLDSRSLLASALEKDELTLASYEFENGINETQYGIEIANKFKIPIYAQKIPCGYVWKNLDKIAQLNNCFTDFLHPRQFATLNNWQGLGDSILLGHWGDVLFDSLEVSEKKSIDEQVSILQNKLVHNSGVELASDLWKNWGLDGSFSSFLINRIDTLYRNINIDLPSARIRAFKSLYWAPRWTSINLSFFSSLGNLVVPYYHDNLCKFICTVPEKFLKGRKIQIEYIKQKYSLLAEVPWQKYHPLNLNNYNQFYNPINYPARVLRKMTRFAKTKFYNIPNENTRNWELQFLGQHNTEQLKTHLLDNYNYEDIISKRIYSDYYEKFKINPVKYAHAVSMLLTLSTFAKRNYGE